MFNHYRIDGLYGVAAATLVLRSRASIAPVPPVGPLSVRIEATCRQRRHLYEQIATVLHAVPSRPAATPLLDHVLDELATLLSDQITRTFAREISRRSNGSDLADVLDVPTGWESWITLRFGRDLSAPAAQRHLAATMTRLLSLIDPAEVGASGQLGADQRVSLNRCRTGPSAPQAMQVTEAVAR